MATKPKRTTQDRLDSAHADLDATKGLRDLVKAIVDASASYGAARVNRMMTACIVLEKHGDKFGEKAVFTSYVKNVAGETAHDWSFLSQVHNYYLGAPKAVSMFANGFIDESALRYWGADVKDYDWGDDQNHTFKVGDDIVIRRTWLNEQCSKIRRQAGALKKKGKKLSKEQLVMRVDKDARAHSTPATQNVSAHTKADKAAKRVLSSIVSDANNQVRPANALTQEKTENLIADIASKLDMVAVPQAEFNRQQAAIEDNAVSAHYWQSLEKIAIFGGIPKDVDEQTAEHVMRFVGRCAAIVKAYDMGDTRSGIKVVKAKFNRESEIA